MQGFEASCKQDSAKLKIKTSIEARKSTLCLEVDVTVKDPSSSSSLRLMFRPLIKTEKFHTHAITSCSSRLQRNSDILPV